MRLTAEKTQRTPYLHLLGMGLTSMCYLWTFYIEVLGLKLRFFHLQSQHFTDRAIYPAAVLHLVKPYSSPSTKGLKQYISSSAYTKASLVLLIQDLQSSKIPCVYSEMELGDLQEQALGRQALQDMFVFNFILKFKYDFSEELRKVQNKSRNSGQHQIPQARK